MNIKRTLKTQDIVVLATVQHLSPSQIATLAHISRQAVWKILKEQGVKTGKGQGGATRVIFECDFCGKLCELTRAKWRSTVHHYCSTECYYASVENPHYFQSRQGQRIARAIVNQHFSLESSHVVHHKDGDTRNNNLDNLAVYSSHADHIKATHHRNSKIKPIWEKE